MALKSKTLNKLPFKSVAGGGSSWTPSAYGTNNYYYTTAGLPFKPINVQLNGVDLTEGTLGALAENQWAWGNALEGPLGERLYVRLPNDTPTGVDPDNLPANSLKASEPILIYQATAAVETINIGIIIANNELLGQNAKVVLFMTDASDNFTFSMMFDINASDAAITFDEKIILEPEHKLKILCDKEYMSVIVSENEG